MTMRLKFEKKKKEKGPRLGVAMSHPSHMPFLRIYPPSSSAATAGEGTTALAHSHSRGYKISRRVQRSAVSWW